MADQEARRAAVGGEVAGEVHIGLAPVSFGAARALIRRSVTDPTPSHERVRLVYSRAPKPTGLSRKESVAIARLRTGHSWLLPSYRARFGRGESSVCCNCSLEEGTLEHLFRCPVTEPRRWSVFGCPGPPLSVMVEDPVAVASYLWGLRLL